jgi:hypothetical protein
MMGHTKAIALPIGPHPLPHRHDLPSDLVPQHKRCFGKAIPFQGVGPTKAAGLHTNQKLASTDIGSGHLLHPYISVVIPLGNSHSVHPSLSSIVISRLSVLSIALPLYQRVTPPETEANLAETRHTKRQHGHSGEAAAFHGTTCDSPRKC